jgi:hypothetical protein
MATENLSKKKVSFQILRHNASTPEILAKDELLHAI